MVRLASVADMEAVLGVERASVGLPHWSEDVWSEVLSDEAGARTVFVVEVADEVVGFLVVARVGEVVEIESIAVMESARRRGLAGQLCMEGTGWGRRLGATQMELEVRASNEAALALYRTLGFVEQGRRRGYYRAPVEDAVLMCVSLADVAGEGGAGMAKV